MSNPNESANKTSIYRKCFILLIAICLIVTVKLNPNNEFKSKWRLLLFKPKIRIFPLKNPLLPEHVYNGIVCKKSAYVTNVNTMICVHSYDKDVHVSGSILGSGVWELHLLG